MKWIKDLDDLIIDVWGCLMLVGITAGLLAFATWTIKLFLRLIGVI